MFQKYYNFHEQRKKFYEKFGFIHFFISIGALIFWVFAFKSSILDANNIPTSSMVPTLKVGDFLFVNKMRYTLRIPFTEYELFRIDYPRRGDIVTFLPPESSGIIDKTLVKRVIGVPGDTIRVEDDEIYVNDMKYPVRKVKNLSILEEYEYPSIYRELDEKYENTGGGLYKESIIDPITKEVIVDHYMLKNPREALPSVSLNLRNPKKIWKIPAKKYMVMGDNRDNSSDSRDWDLIDLEKVQGKVFMIYFSVNWGSRVDAINSMREPENPFVNVYYLFKYGGGDAFVRWGRIFDRVY
ncbi:MAG: signal peptidase I [Spirochaetia bacterium]|nr:signal peptidase I [Spirochaetia bacterium]